MVGHRRNKQIGRLDRCSPEAALNHRSKLLISLANRVLAARRTFPVENVVDFICS